MTSDYLQFRVTYAVFKVLAGILSSSLAITMLLNLTCFDCSGFLPQVEVSGLEPLTSCLQSRRSTD